MSTPSPEEQQPLHYRQNKIPSTSSGNIYSLLDEEQKKFADTKKVSATHRLRQWLKFFEKTEAYDERLDYEYTWLGGCSPYALLILGFIGSIVGFANQFIWLFIPALLAFIAGIVMIVAGKNNRRRQINNHFRLYVLPLLHILREDAGDEARVQLNCDFSDFELPAYAIKPPAHAPQVPSNTQQEYFEVKWLEMQIELLDKTELKIELSDLVRRRTRRRRNPRGKMKTKIKHKTTHKIKLKIAFHKDRYKPDGLGGALAYERDGDYYQYTIEQKHRIEGVPNHQDVSPLLAAIADGYRRVKPV